MLSRWKCGVTSVLVLALTTLILSASAIAHWDDDKGSSGLSEAEEHGLIFIREEEKLARDSYMILYAIWDLSIFENISESEQRHMDAVENLIEKYGLTDPVSDESSLGGFGDEDLNALFKQLMELGMSGEIEALTVGAIIEDYDIVDINHAMESVDHDDIYTTYESLVCGSRNHLRSFVEQLDKRGVTYAPQFLDQEDYDAIIGSLKETDCGSGGEGRKGRR